MAGTTRRDLLRIGALLGMAGLVMARPWRGLRRPELDFEPMPDLPPLRRLSRSGEASGGSPARAVFAGLGEAAEPTASERGAERRLRADICGAFGLSWGADEPLPVTYFTDIRCPSCRRLEASLSALAADGPTRMLLTTREFPVFGPRSEAAARAIVAAAALGAAERFRARLRARPAPADRQGVRGLARSLDVDPDAYLEAWLSPTTAARLAEDRALARLIGLPGTPGLVVGRTVTVGVPPRDTLRHLMRVERRDGPPDACA